MALDPRTPVIVAAAQYTQRVAEGDPLLEPADLMVATLRRAEADSGGKGLLAAAETVRHIRLSSARYGDPARLVAERMGANNVRQTAFATNGGQVVGTVVARTAEDVLSGAFDVAVIVGGETWKSHLTAQRSGSVLAWTPQQDGTEPDIVIGPPLDFRHPAEDGVGATMPVHIYPIIENAMRAAAGRTIAQHQAYLGDLWVRFSQVAVDNPYAWDRTPYTAEQIVTPSPANRMVSFPYTKLMMSNEQVDQAAGIVMCTVEKARALGVPEDRWVFPYACSEASAPTVAERPDLAISPMLRECGDALWKPRGWVLTPSPTSISTRASRRPCNNRPWSSASASTANSPSLAGCASPADLGTTTPCRA
jgi:acetyl-CoA C-acetyltransferase